jgi:cytochrome c-type biogenesis protein CcmH
MRKFIVAGLLAGSIVGTPLFAADAPSASADPLLEKRVMQISEELRCLVCQNQTIADSHAELAVDLRNQVREMLKKGMSEPDIKSYMVQRYGDFILYRPPVKGNTWLLWGGPFVLLLGGLGFLFIKLRQRGRKVDAADGTMDEASVRRAERLLGIDETQAGKKEGGS